MSNAQLIANATNAIKQSNMPEEERKKLIAVLVAPLSLDDLNYLLREGVTAVDASVTLFVKYKEQYLTKELKSGTHAVITDTFIKEYRNAENQYGEMFDEIFKQENVVELSQVESAIRSGFIDDMLADEDIKSAFGDTFINWNAKRIINLAKEAFMSKQKEKNTNTQSEQTESVSVEVKTVSEPETKTEPEVKTEAGQPTAKVEPNVSQAVPLTPSAVQPADANADAEAKKEEPEKEYVQWTRDLCETTHTQAIAEGLTDEKAARRAALTAKLVGGFYENLDKAKEADVRRDTGVYSYEQDLAEEARIAAAEANKEEAPKKRNRYLDNVLGFLNPQPLATKANIHVTHFKDKLLSWV